jgi:hypothetical protein
LNWDVFSTTNLVETDQSPARYVFGLIDWLIHEPVKSRPMDIFQQLLAMRTRCNTARVKIGLDRPKPE